jgi:hypothetical protein
MKYFSLLFLFIFIYVVVQAQEIPPQSIEDSVLGWMKVYHLTSPKKPLQFLIGQI